MDLDDQSVRSDRDGGLGQRFDQPCGSARMGRIHHDRQVRPDFSTGTALISSVFSSRSRSRIPRSQRIICEFPPDMTSSADIIVDGVREASLGGSAWISFEFLQGSKFCMLRFSDLDQVDELERFSWDAFVISDDRQASVAFSPSGASGLCFAPGTRTATFSV